MKVALAFIGGACVAAVAFLLIERPQKVELPPLPAPAVSAGPVLEPPPPASISAPVNPPKPAPVVAREPARPKPIVAARKEAAPEIVIAPAVPPSAPAEPPPPPQSPAVAEIARLSRQEAQTPAIPEKPPGASAAVKAPAVPLMKPDAVEIKRAKDERTPETVTIPAGTVLQVRLNQSLSSELNENGDTFSATLEEPVIVNGFVIAEKGSRLDGRVIEATRSGRVKGLARISIRLATLHTADRQRVSIFTEEFVHTAKKSVGKDTTKVAIGAGIGAALGAVLGGGAGAAIGAATGAGAGAGSVLLTRGRVAELAVETRIPFRLRDDVTITESLN